MASPGRATRRLCWSEIIALNNFTGCTQEAFVRAVAKSFCAHGAYAINPSHVAHKSKVVL